MGEELPEGWAWGRMEDAGRWSTGGTPSRKVQSYFGGDIPWVKSGDLNDGIVTTTEERLTREGLANCAARALPRGTVSIALYGATIGKLGILDVEAATNQACANCAVDGRFFERTYVFYYLLSQRRALVDAGQGGAQPNLTNGIVRDWPFPLAPLAEQRRIVAQVEALLARVQAARARLAKVPALLKRFRQSVLAAACSGQLTADWRETNGPSKTASRLLERIVAERSAAEARARGKRRPSDEEDATSEVLAVTWDVPDSWAWSSMKDLLHYDRSAAYGVLQPGDDLPDGVPFVRVCDLVNGVIDPRSIKRISPNIDRQYPRTRLLGGEVLVTLVGTIGRTAVVDASMAGANVARAIGMLPLCPHVVPAFVRCALDQPAKNKELNDLAREVARKTLNLGLLKAVRIPIAPLPEQREIVRRVETLFAVADKIEARVAAAMGRVEKITQAILAKAFRGELVPTEAELARAEGRDYEPASALLERLRTIRSAAESLPPPVRQRQRASGGAGKLPV